MPKLYEVINDGGVKKAVSLSGSGSGGGSTIIDDTTTAADKVWSSNKINNELTSKASISSIGIWTNPVVCAIGDTSCTIINEAIDASKFYDIYEQNDSNTDIIPASKTVLDGQIVLNFEALEEETSFVLHIWN